MRAAFLLAFALAATPACAFPRVYDGQWAVEAHTTVGPCAPVTTGTVSIRDGRVVASSGAGVEVWGFVDDKKEVSARFTSGQHIFRASGKMKAADANELKALFTETKS